MFTKFEGIYGQIKDPSIDWVKEMKTWMINNSDLIDNGDLWTPIPEPQNGGIKGVNCYKDCIFNSNENFNNFLREITLTAKDTLATINKNNVEAGVFNVFFLFSVIYNYNSNFRFFRL
jgi:hypothetical protein